MRKRKLWYEERGQRKLKNGKRHCCWARMIVGMETMRGRNLVDNHSKNYLLCLFKLVTTVVTSFKKMGTQRKEVPRPSCSLLCPEALQEKAADWLSFEETRYPKTCSLISFAMCPSFHKGFPQLSGGTETDMNLKFTEWPATTLDAFWWLGRLPGPGTKLRGHWQTTDQVQWEGGGLDWV